MSDDTDKKNQSSEIDAQADGPPAPDSGPETPSKASPAAKSSSHAIGDTSSETGGEAATAAASTATNPESTADQSTQPPAASTAEEAGAPQADPEMAPASGTGGTVHHLSSGDTPSPDSTDVPPHEVPQHDSPAAHGADVPPHEVPPHQVPPVGSQDPAAPPAEPAPIVDPTVVNQAVDVIANSNNQKQAVHQAYELQKATIAHGIKTRREAAMEQAAAAKANIGQQTAAAPQQGATPMNQQYAAAGAPHPGQQYQAAPQPGVATHPGMAGYAGAAPLSQNEIIAQEFATTIRQIIAEEVDKQLKALLAAYTTAEAQKTESPDGQA